jgi:hypothetical protein
MGLGSLLVVHAIMERQCVRSETGKAAAFQNCSYLSLIGGAIFSAGVGGSAGLAVPSVCACESGRAGSGADVVGRVPPGVDSAGLSL